MKNLKNFLISVTLTSVVAAQEIPQKALDQARAELQRAVQDGEVAGAAHLVVRDGKVLHSEVAGLSDSEDKTPLKLDSLLRIYSMSKPIITVAAMTLYEQGRFNLDDPVARFIPAFSNATVIQKDGDTIQRVAPKRQVSMRGAQFDIQTSPTETMLRVNEGSARVRQNLDGSTVEVSKGRQVAASLSRKEPLSVTPQPRPINSWASDLWQIPQVILGKWLPQTGNERARLGADPLLWPISDRDSVMLYAVALAAWKSTERPVLLRSDSKLRFRGRTERAQTVRFGFSAQKMRGVFAGKFEVDVPPASLRPAGETWEVELSLRDFRPLHPQLASSPDGLEMTDVYALTVKEDAGLEIHHIELLPREAAKPPEKQ